MYFPKSQIKINQITNGGEYQYLSTGEEYIGSFFTTSTGKIFSGKTPKDRPVLELVPLDDTFTVSKYDADDDPVGSWGGDASLYTLDEVYLDSTTLDFTKEAPLPPKQFYVRPTEKNYERGEVLRFFASKRNEPLFIEIDIEQFKQFKAESETKQFRLYKVYSLFWQISGNKNEVANTNKKTVDLVANNNGDPSFPSFFKGNFLQYYKPTGVEENLITDGTEFINRRTKEVYSGPYHIHPEKGPMVGAVHINIPHDFLDPIESLSSELTGSVDRPTETPTPTPSAPSGGYSGGGGGGGY
tara:strand:- start:587 stop:1483 length:897 start_codon:yes stop_codon:yes gene_type:complete